MTNADSQGNIPPHIWKWRIAERYARRVFSDVAADRNCRCRLCNSDSVNAALPLRMTEFSGLTCKTVLNRDTTWMESEKHASKAQLNTVHELTSTLTREKDDLNGLYAKEKAERVQLEKKYQQMHLAHTKSETQIAGLNQRLADRQSEIDGMHTQLEKARTQFARTLLGGVRKWKIAHAKNY